MKTVVRRKYAPKYRITSLGWINDELDSPKLICNDLQISIISKIDDARCCWNQFPISPTTGQDFSRKVQKQLPFLGGIVYNSRKIKLYMRGMWVFFSLIKIFTKPIGRIWIYHVICVTSVGFIYIWAWWYYLFHN